MFFERYAFTRATNICDLPAHSLAYQISPDEGLQSASQKRVLKNRTTHKMENLPISSSTNWPSRICQRTTRNRFNWSVRNNSCWIWRSETNARTRADADCSRLCVTWRSFSKNLEPGTSNSETIFHVSNVDAPFRFYDEFFRSKVDFPDSMMKLLYKLFTVSI